MRPTRNSSVLRWHQRHPPLSDVTDPAITCSARPNGASVIVARAAASCLSWPRARARRSANGRHRRAARVRTPTRRGGDVHAARAGRPACSVSCASCSGGPRGVGLLGFSAGGTRRPRCVGPLAAPTSSRTRRPHGPDFRSSMAAASSTSDKTKFRPGASVPADARPPSFLSRTTTNSTPFEAAMFTEYKRRNRPPAAHLRQGRPVGMRKEWDPISDWPARCGSGCGARPTRPDDQSPGRRLFRLPRPIAGTRRPAGIASGWPGPRIRHRHRPARRE